MEVRRLREEDDRSSFSCGDDDLDRFFRRYAGQNQFRSHFGVSYVAVEADAVLGYATIAPGHLEIDRLPASSRKRLPGYPLPILRLARLAVALPKQGRGIGMALLRHVFALALQLDADFGCGGLVVDAKASAAPFYERLGFFELEVVEGGLQTRPQPKTLFLPLEEIRAAHKSR
ncbi:MAG: GNAT family N-acetyltransferase [Polyangia bacterium]|jgi:GNAT superfamily N-acetyltransferase